MNGIEQILESIVRRVVREELAAQRAPERHALLTVVDYAAAHAISPSTVRKAIAAGRLEVTRIGRSVRIAADAIIRSRSAPARTQHVERALGIVRGGR